MNKYWVGFDFDGVLVEFPGPGEPYGRDIQELRTKMYHKHTDPKQERLCRLIDLVRTA
jgi:hypothetical protein